MKKKWRRIIIRHLFFFSKNQYSESSADIENLYLLVALKRAVLTGELGVIEIEIRHVHRGYDEPIGCPLA